MYTFVRRGEPHHLEGYPSWLASLLHARGVTTQEEAQAFLNPSLSQLHDPMALHQLGDAANIIRTLGAQGVRAVVYGDYDVDGLCASVIAKEALEAAGLSCAIYIPDRHSEGYGLNEEAVRALSKDAQLLVTVDCGITAINEVQVAKELGMTVIVTDHHQPGDSLPSADAVVNPLLGDYAFPALCGAGTAWKLSQALHGMAFAMGQLDLAAIATIADMVPLRRENRVLAALGLKALATTSRVGLRALKGAMGLEEGQPVSAERIGFGLAPRLNAGGRLTTAQEALALLLAQDPVEAHHLAMNLNQLNADRQQEERQVLEQAEQLLDQVDLLRGRVIVLHQEGWNLGVVGLAAGRLAERYGCPTVVLSRQGDTATGSGRSAGDIDLYAALDACRHLFLRFGGHRQAAGLSLKTENIPAFAQCFQQAVEDQLAGRPLPRQVPYDAPMEVSEVSLEAIRQLEQLAPFGIGNPSPAFLLEDVQVVSPRTVGGEGQHLKLEFRQGAGFLDAIAWRMGEQLTGLPPTVRTVVRLGINDYQGRQSPQAQVTALQAGSLAFSSDPALERAALLQDLQQAASGGKLLNGKVASLKEDAAFPPQGALLVCRCHETALAMRERYPELNTAGGPYRDRRGTSTVLYGVSLQEVKAPVSHLVFCDGLVSSKEAAWALGLFPQARLFARVRTQALKELLLSLRPSLEELRQAYVLLRQGVLLESLPWPWEKALTMAMVLREMGLVALEGHQVTLLPPNPTDPKNSPLYQILHEEDVWPTQSSKA